MAPGQAVLTARRVSETFTSRLNIEELRSTDILTSAVAPNNHSEIRRKKKKWVFIQILSMSSSGLQLNFWAGTFQKPEASEQSMST